MTAKIAIGTKWANKSSTIIVIFLFRNTHSFSIFCSTSTSAAEFILADSLSLLFEGLDGSSSISFSNISWYLNCLILKLESSVFIYIFTYILPSDKISISLSELSIETFKSGIETFSISESLSEIFLKILLYLLFFSLI